jgi:hypothetical protein
MKRGFQCTSERCSPTLFLVALAAVLAERSYLWACGTGPGSTHLKSLSDSAA